MATGKIANTTTVIATIPKEYVTNGGSVLNVICYNGSITRPWNGMLNTKGEITQNFGSNLIDVSVSGSYVI